MSPLSLAGGSPHPLPAAATAAKVDCAGKPLPSNSTSGFPLGPGGHEQTTKATDPPPAPHDGMSVSTMSSTTTEATGTTAATPKGAGGGDRGAGVSVGADGGSGGGSSSKSLAIAASVHLAARTLVSNTINRKHGRTTNGAVVLKAAAWGIEPRLALDKKTHAVLEQDGSSAGAASGRDGAGAGNRGGGGGQQFLKFEAWSTRASSPSSPWAAHPTLRRQASGRRFDIFPAGRIKSRHLHYNLSVLVWFRGTDNVLLHLFYTLPKVPYATQ